MSRFLGGRQRQPQAKQAFKNCDSSYVNMTRSSMIPEQLFLPLCAAHQHQELQVSAFAFERRFHDRRHLAGPVLLELRADLAAYLAAARRRQNGGGLMPRHSS